MSHVALGGQASGVDGGNERGVVARSLAIGSAAPRQQVNGDTTIRRHRTGTSSGTRGADCSSSRLIGSGRSGGGLKAPWLSLSTSARASLPRAARSAGVLRVSRAIAGHHHAEGEDVARLTDDVRAAGGCALRSGQLCPPG